MALWLVRPGRNDSDVVRILSENRIWIGQGQGIHRDLGKIRDKDQLARLVEESRPDDSSQKRGSFVGKIFSFTNRMNVGDWVVVPNGTKGTIHIAEITSDYVFDPKATEKPFHYRNVKWIKTAIPRTDFDPDLLYSFGGQSTIYLPKAKDAELRVKELAGKGRPERVVPVPVENGDEPPGVDYELLARDQITNLIIRKYKGHELERFVEAILIARGYVTHRSPTGPDKGVDILAAAGPLGFANPRICVQVKATEGPVDAPTLNQLIGTMQNVKADQGLLVSWGGFTKAVEKERAAQFFHVRLWDREALIDEFLGVYDKLDAEIRAEIPIKQIWSIAAQDDDEE